MSYRLHLVYCNTEDLEELRRMHMTPVELGQGDDSEYFFPDMIEEYKLDDFLPGKMDILTQVGQPLFHDTLVQDYFSHYAPKVISQDELLRIIDACRVRILGHYQSLIADPKKCEAEIRDKIDTWTAEFVTPYNLEENLTRLVDSYDNDYQIWDLIHMYKRINWSEHTVVLYGW